jgi:hypothetical protein
MVVIILEEDIHNNNDNDNFDNNNFEKTESCDVRANIIIDTKEGQEGQGEGGQEGGQEGREGREGQEQEGQEQAGQEQGGQEGQEKNANVSPPKQKYIGIEVYTHLQHTLESQKMYPLLPCNMISSFARVMEYVEYFDLPSEERKKLVVDLVKILAYSNNDYGSRDCFEYFMEHNMIDDIIKTIVDSTKNRYDINRFPHTNRKIVLSCVSLSNKIKIAKPNVKIESLFEEFKVNLCGLKRFFKMKDKKEESKQT